MLQPLLPYLLLSAAAVGTLAQDTHLVSERWVNAPAEARTPGSGSLLAKRHIDENNHYNVTFLHVNDVHAHLDQYRASGTDCPTDGSVPCLGGYARILDAVRDVRAGVQDSLLLNAGDEFQGTLFYTFYGGKKIAETLNRLNFSCFTLGNHEFDGGEAPLAEFLSDLTFPTVSTNVRSQYLPLQSRLYPYIVFEEHELAVVALTTVDTPDISKPGKTTVFGSPSTLQRTVDLLLDGTLGNGKVKRVIALTHIGYEEDQKLARSTRNIHLIVGGHSHTPLGGEPWYSQGPYPTIVKNLDGEEVFIVTSYRWGEHLGRIDVAFERESGKVAAYSGGPVRLTEEWKQDKPTQELITSWRKPFQKYANKVLGYTKHDLDQSTCMDKECTLGNAVCDAMLYSRWAVGARHVDFAMHNSGGIRATIPAPNITQGVLVTAFPFQNGIVDLELTGAELWDIFEGIASGVNKAGKPVTSSAQLSKGISYSYNPSNPLGSRLISLSIGLPKLQPVNLTHTYTVATLDFLVTGGDSILPYPMKTSPPPLASQDEALRAYVKKFSPLDVRVEGRIRRTGETVPQKPKQVIGDDDEEKEWAGATAGQQQLALGEKIGERWGGWRAWVAQRERKIGQWL